MYFLYPLIIFPSPGAAVGIDVTPERFTDPTVLRQLDVVTPINNLYMTGQDTVLCGVTLCQVRIDCMFPRCLFVL